jgi:hypothetical protein
MRDSLQVRISDNAAYLFISSESDLVWQGLRHEATEKIVLKRFAILQSLVSENHAHFDGRRGRTEKEDFDHSVRFQMIAGSSPTHDFTITAWSVPHWSVVLILTTISAPVILYRPLLKPSEQSDA